MQDTVRFLLRRDIYSGPLAKTQLVQPHHTGVMKCTNVSVMFQYLILICKYETVSVHVCQKSCFKCYVLFCRSNMLSKNWQPKREKYRKRVSSIRLLFLKQNGMQLFLSNMSCSICVKKYHFKSEFTIQEKFFNTCIWTCNIITCIAKASVNLNIPGTKSTTD